MPLPNNRPHVSLNRNRNRQAPQAQNNNARKQPQQPFQAPEQYYYQQPASPNQQMPYENQNPSYQQPMPPQGYYSSNANIQNPRMMNNMQSPVYNNQPQMMPSQQGYYDNQQPMNYEQQAPQSQPSTKRRRRNASNDDGMNVPVYDLSNGYPKGLSEGVEVIRTVGGKRKKIHGVPYEALTQDIQQDLDEHPLDDAGQLRVFINDRFYGVGHYIELGSDAHANKFMNSLRAQGNRLL